MSVEKISCQHQSPTSTSPPKTSYNHESSSHQHTTVYASHVQADPEADAEVYPSESDAEVVPSNLADDVSGQQGSIVLLSQEAHHDEAGTQCLFSVCSRVPSLRRGDISRTCEVYGSGRPSPAGAAGEVRANSHVRAKKKHKKRRQQSPVIRHQRSKSSDDSLPDESAMSCESVPPSAEHSTKNSSPESSPGGQPVSALSLELGESYSTSQQNHKENSQCSRLGNFTATQGFATSTPTTTTTTSRSTQKESATSSLGYHNYAAPSLTTGSCDTNPGLFSSPETQKAVHSRHRKLASFLALQRRSGDSTSCDQTDQVVSKFTASQDTAAPVSRARHGKHGRVSACKSSGGHFSPVQIGTETSQTNSESGFCSGELQQQQQLISETSQSSESNARSKAELRRAKAVLEGRSLHLQTRTKNSLDMGSAEGKVQSVEGEENYKLKVASKSHCKTFSTGTVNRRTIGAMSRSYLKSLGKQSVFHTMTRRDHKKKLNAKTDRPPLSGLFTSDIINYPDRSTDNVAGSSGTLRRTGTDTVADSSGTLRRTGTRARGSDTATQANATLKKRPLSANNRSERGKVSRNQRIPQRLEDKKCSSSKFPPPKEVRTHSARLQAQVTGHNSFTSLSFGTLKRMKKPKLEASVVVKTTDLYSIRKEKGTYKVIRNLPQDR